MEDGNIAVLVEAKAEYTNQIVNVLKQNMYQGIKNIYLEAKSECELNKDHDNTIKMFQVEEPIIKELTNTNEQETVQL